MSLCEGAEEANGPGEICQNSGNGTAGVRKLKQPNCSPSSPNKRKFGRICFPSGYLLVSYEFITDNWSTDVLYRIASLAPLSKCTNLHLLDLSADRYKMELSQIFDAVSQLEHLKILKLPKDSLRDLNRQKTFTYNWPKNLQQLCSVGWPCSHAMQWERLFEMWPETLRTFEMHEVPRSEPLIHLELCETTAGSIQRLVFGTFGEGPGEICPLSMFLRHFPRLRKLTTPAVQTILNPPEILSLDDIVLEVLVLATSAWDIYANPNLNKLLDFEALNRCVDMMPHLRRVEVPEFFVKLKDESDQRAFEELTSKLEERGHPDKRASSGIFLLESH